MTGGPVGSSTAPPLRVLFVIYGLERAGPERRLLDFARYLPPEIEVHVCVIGTALTMLPEFEAAGARMLVVPIGRAYAEWDKLRTIARYVREQRIDVVNSFNLKTLIVSAAVGLLAGRSVRRVHHLISLWEDVTPAAARVTRALMATCDRIVCNGRAVHDRLIGTGPLAARTVVIPNGVDLTAFTPTPARRAAARAALGADDGDYVVGAVANIRPVKNLPMLLRAADRLHARRGDVRVLIVGGGPDLESLRGEAAALPIGARTTFTGPREDVAAQLAACDVLAMPSWSEGNPNVVVQAMAMGLPVVASAVGEIPFLLEQGRHGVLIAPGDEAALLAGLEAYASDPARRTDTGEAARRHAACTYALDRMIDAYRALYRAIGGTAH